MFLGTLNINEETFPTEHDFFCLLDVYGLKENIDILLSKQLRLSTEHFFEILDVANKYNFSHLTEACFQFFYIFAEAFCPQDYAGLSQVCV